MLYFCATQYNIHVLITHFAGTENSIADALFHSQVHRFCQLGPKGNPQPRHHPCMADLTLEGLLSHYQSLGVAQLTHSSYQTRV